jgi:hypothetical protein
VLSNVTHRHTERAPWADQPFGQRYSTAIVSALCFGALSGLGQAAVMLFTDLPSLELSKMIWTSF